MKNQNKAYLKYNLFNSLHHPLYYIVAIVFSLITSISFFKNFFAGDSTTNLITYFYVVPYICIVAIPALCFKRSDSIYDNFVPLSSINKIYIRFLAIFILYAILILLIIPLSFCINFFGSVDGGQIFTSVLCLLFYGACSISLCLLISEFFNNDISSFIVSAIILTVVNTAHLLTVYFNINTFFASVIKIFSFVWHFDAASKGILDTRDIIWFIGITFFFLNASVFIKNKKAGLIRTKNLKYKNVLLVAINFLVILNGYRWYNRFDFSKNKTYSISKYSKQVVNSVQENIKITYYRSQTLSKVYPQIRDVSDFLISYSQQSKNVVFTIKDPDKDEQSAQLLQNYGITTQPFKKPKSNNSVEYVNIYSAIIIEYNGNKELIPFVMSSNSLEYDVTGRILHLITGQSRVVNIVVGNELSLEEQTGYSQLIPILNMEGFLCNPLYIDDPNFVQNLSLCTGPLLVIGDSQIKIEQAIAIETYILTNKGNALFTVSPFSVNVFDWNITQNKNTNIVEILENWGITFNNAILNDVSCAVVQMESQDASEDNYTQTNYRQDINYPYFISVMPQANSNFGFTLFWPTQLTINSENVKPYIYTSEYSWATKIDLNSTDKLIETNPFFVTSFDGSNKDVRTNVAVANITGKLNGLFTTLSCDFSNIIVIPDSYFLNTITNSYIGGTYGDLRNYSFLVNCLLKLNGEEQLSILHNKSVSENSLFKITNEQDFTKYKNYTILLITLLPILIILIFVYLNVRRIIKNKKVVEKK